MGFKAPTVPKHLIKDNEGINNEHDPISVRPLCVGQSSDGGNVLSDINSRVLMEHRMHPK
jgi:hypothetical protein